MGVQPTSGIDKQRQLCHSAPLLGQRQEGAAWLSPRPCHSLLARGGVREQATSGGHSSSSFPAQGSGGVALPAMAVKQRRGRETEERERRETWLVFGFIFLKNFQWKHENLATQKLLKIQNPTTFVSGTNSFEA